MGLFDIIGFAAEKAYGKYKDSKMESSMDALLEALDTCSVNLEVMPYKEGENPHVLHGIVSRLNNQELDRSSATYFLTTNQWLKKRGVDIDNEGIYLSSFNEKGGYAILNLSKKHPDPAKNYKSKYPGGLALVSLLVYLNESSTEISVPKYFKDKDGTTKLSKKATMDNFGEFEKICRDNPSDAGIRLKNFYLRAKTFGYLVAKELNSYNKNDLDSAFKQFEEQHGKNAEITYTF